MRIIAIAFDLPMRARQALRAAGPGDDADVDLRLAELRALPGDDEVERHRQLAAAAQGPAVDRGDHRLRDPANAIPLADAVGEQHVDRRRARHLADVGARGERPLVAGHHDRADAVVSVELLERFAQRVHDRAVERVQLLRPVEPDQGGALLGLALDEDELLARSAHGGLAEFQWRVTRSGARSGRDTHICI